MEDIILLGLGGHAHSAVPNIVDRTAVVSENVELEEGIFVGKR